jgi:hypothetical protein
MRVTAFVPAICAMLAVPVPGGGAAGKLVPPRVYVYTAQSPSGIVTEEEQGRLDSTRDLRDALRRNSRIVLVSHAGEAQVVVEVLDREKRERPIGGFGGTAVTPSGETIVRVRVKFGDEQTEIKGIGQAYWSRAARDAAERLLKWIARVSPRVKG